MDPEEEVATAPEQEPTVQPASEMPDNVDSSIKEASPEEQAQYDHFVGKAMEVIYSEKMFDKIVDLLDGGADGKDGGDPIKGLAIAAEMVVARIGAAAEQAGETLSPDVVLHAGAEILEDLANISKEAKIHDFAGDPDGLEAAWYQALDLFRERLEKSGELDKQKAAQDLDKLIAMDQNGTLEKILRDLAANDEAGPAGGEEPPPPAKAKTKGFATAMEA
jgi:hypothetical protein